PRLPGGSRSVRLNLIDEALPLGYSVRHSHLGHRSYRNTHTSMFDLLIEVRYGSFHKPCIICWMDTICQQGSALSLAQPACSRPAWGSKSSQTKSPLDGIFKSVRLPHCLNQFHHV